VLDKAEYSAFKSTLNSSIVSYRIVVHGFIDIIWWLNYAANMFIVRHWLPKLSLMLALSLMSMTRQVIFVVSSSSLQFAYIFLVNILQYLQLKYW